MQKKKGNIKELSEKHRKPQQHMISETNEPKKQKQQKCLQSSYQKKTNV